MNSQRIFVPLRRNSKAAKRWHDPHCENLASASAGLAVCIEVVPDLGVFAERNHHGNTRHYGRV
jgi:hypothetical protein